MKKIIFALFLILILATASYYWLNPLTAKVKINNHVFYVDLAVTPKEKEKGLGGRNELSPDRGMLFVFDHKEQYPFWMKEMRFPLDFIWIDDKTVVDITPNVPVPASSFLPIYHPRVPVDKILEINAGEVQKWGIQAGDSVNFLN